MGLRVKFFNIMGVHLKTQFLGGFMKNHYIGGCLKRELGQFADLIGCSF